MRKYKTKSDTHIKQMESIYANKTLELEDKIQLAFGLGKAYEDLKDYAKAFEYLEEGNSLHRQRLKYSTSSRIKAFLDIKREFNHDFFNTDLETYSESNKMIFIIGMPRSGTSLVEQILSSHSKVHGAGELRFLRDSIEKIFHKEGKIFPNNIKEQDKKAFFLLAEDYLRRVNSVAPINSKYVTDKMPYNFMHAGLISKSFPKAKIILCQRDPFDNCFSIYKQKFGTGNDYAYSLKEIGEYYNLYKDLIKHWDSVIPSKLFTVSYEDLIENQEKVSKNLIAHCNLEWEDECLSFHDTKREVLTASAVQVRKPIYKTSVNLWKKYGNNLELLRDLLKQER